LLDLWQVEHLEGEKFETFVERIGLARIREAVKDLRDLPPYAQAPDQYLDWGSTEQFKVQTGEGECAS